MSLRARLLLTKEANIECACAESRGWGRGVAIDSRRFEPEGFLQTSLVRDSGRWSIWSRCPTDLLLKGEKAPDDNEHGTRETIQSSITNGKFVRVVQPT